MVLHMEVGDIIKKLRKEHNLTQEQLGEILGVQKSAIAKYEKGRVENLKRSTIQKMASYFKVSPLLFLGYEDEINNSDNLYDISTQTLPMLGSVACGEPIYCEEDRESYVKKGVEVKADFCLKAQGDSMINARINDGDIVFIRKQDIVNNGEIAVVIIDDSATLKRFYYYKEKNMVILKPENPKYEDIILTGEALDKIRVLGKAVAFQSDVD